MYVTYVNPSTGQSELKGVAGSLQVISGQPAEIIDDYTTAGIVYHCVAEPGSLTSAAVWQITKLTVATGRVTHADGDEEFDNIADNRASLTYA